MKEFRLPDRLRDLVAAEGRLKEELSRRQKDYELVCRNLPPECNPQKTPAFYTLLVAHRRWQHALEKRMVVQRGRAKA